MTIDFPPLRQLKMLRAVAHFGGLSAAARASNLTQPAISQALAKIEAEFGITVFERSPRGVSLTDAGQVLVMRVDRALDELSKGITECIATLGTRRPDAMRLITTAQLIALVAVVEEGTFGAAARTAGRARATIHRAARELERVLGVKLYESTSHGLRATREAERLVHRVRLASTELLQARAELAALKGRDDGITTIGAMPLARSLLVPSAVLEFIKRRPGHSISILDGPYETMLESLRDGRADVLVGALRSRVPPDVRQELLFEDPLVIVMRAGHPLARDKHRLSWSSLARFDWIAPRPGSPLRAHYDRVIARLARPRGAAIECNSLIAARAVLVASDRVMLSSEQQVHYELATGQLAVSPHPGGDIRRKIGLTTRRDWLPTEAQDELLAAIRSTAIRGRGTTMRMT